MSWYGRIGPTLGVLSLALSGCQTPEGFDDRPIPAAELLSGDAIFGEPVSSSERPDIDILATDQAMRAFVAEVLDASRESTRFRALLDKLRRAGYALSGYDPYLNLTARETFFGKRGNCLSYTNLFVALAREAGFDAKYQLVDVPPDYDSVDGVVVQNKHVNVLVENVPGRGAVTVEFSEEFASGIHDRHMVDDGYALALHYNNIAFTRELAGDLRGAFVYLRRAIEAVPDNVDFWANLGSFYSRQGHLDHAVAAHRRALDLDISHGAAIRGLVNAYAELGRGNQLRFYQRRLAHSRARDAHTYFILAQRAYDAERSAESLDLVTRAIRLHGGDHRFHRLQGEIHDRLGNELEADRSFKRARMTARNDDARRPRGKVRERYPGTRVVIPSRNGTRVF